jgi:hypothetical protein
VRHLGATPAARRWWVGYLTWALRPSQPRDVPESARSVAPRRHTWRQSRTRTAARFQTSSQQHLFQGVGVVQVGISIEDGVVQMPLPRRQECSHGFLSTCGCTSQVSPMQAVALAIRIVAAVGLWSADRSHRRNLRHRALRRPYCQTSTAGQRPRPGYSPPHRPALTRRRPLQRPVFRSFLAP